MAALIGRVKGNRGEVHRLGSRASGIYTEAATWQTFANVALHADGSGGFRLSDKSGRTIVKIEWAPEDVPADRRMVLR